MLQKIVFLAGGIVLALLAVVSIAFGGSAGVTAAQDPTPTLVMPPAPVMGELDMEALAAVDLAEFPIIPEISDNALAIYRAGLDAGADPHSFAKVGDCMTDNPNFLIPIGSNEYALGEYESLAAVIEFYASEELDVFGRKSQAAAGGFNSASVLDSMWANPEFCEAGETPLACEFRLTNPSVALIMFGTNDVFYLAEPQYDFFLRSIVAETIQRGVLPVLSTFPLRPEFPEKSLTYNQIVAQVALDYDVPLINLWQALEPLENQGIDQVETTHMTAPENNAACYFLSDQLDYGFTVRNLVTLQTLEALLAAADES